MPAQPRRDRAHKGTPMAFSDRPAQFQTDARMIARAVQTWGQQDPRTVAVTTALMKARKMTTVHWVVLSAAVRELAKEAAA